MLPKIALITILTNNVETLVGFYRDVLGFPVQQDLGSYVEFSSPGVRFAICTRQIMADATNHHSFNDVHRGQAFELAFPCLTPKDVDSNYNRLTAMGATPVHSPADMPWGQRTAFFADPDGNIHELFADIPIS